jgi:hypothetical protein
MGELHETTRAKLDWLDELGAEARDHASPRHVVRQRE